MSAEQPKAGERKSEYHDLDERRKSDGRRNSDHHDETAQNGESDGHGKAPEKNDAKKNDGEWKPGKQDDEEIELPEPTHVKKGHRALFIGIGIAVIAILFLAGFLPRMLKHRSLNANAVETETARPRIEIIKAKVITSDRALELPGTVQPLEETVLYPRADGYVRRWLVDIGDNVKEGQLLAEIETPELDAQIEQARADLAQAEAGKIRAETTASLSATEKNRYETLTPAGVASGQDLDSRRAQAKVDEANTKVAIATVASQQASLHRLTQLKGFARVIAPFAGTVTSRTIERGALVTTGNSTPLFRIAATDPVRIFVQVPQDVAPNIHPSVPAALAVREFAGRRFDGVIARAAGELDAATRTMTTEVRIPNPKHELLPGMFGRVAITLPTPHRLFELPATALYSDSKGSRVAIVDSNNKVTMQPISIERDTGATVEIATGLIGDERVVRIANAALRDGSTVEIIESSGKDGDKKDGKSETQKK